MITICIEWYDNVCLDILMTFLAISPSTKQTSGLWLFLFLRTVHTSTHLLKKFIYNQEY